MPESNPNFNYGRKRRLPSWMYGTSTIETEISEAIIVDEQLEPIKVGGSKKKKDDAIVSSKEPTLELETEKKPRRQDVTHKAPSTTSPLSRQASLQRKEWKNRSFGKRGKQRTTLYETEGTNGTGCIQGQKNLASVEENDGEMVLTVDDLISIAREFVNADAEKKKQKAVADTATTEVVDFTIKSTNSNFKLPAGIGFNASSGSESKGILASERTMVPCGSSVSKAEGKTEHHKDENSILDTVKTGDAAQDMLSLFLGPLLQKPEPRHRVSDDSASEVYPTNRVVPPKMQETVIKAEAPADKKKSSLREKVSFFL